MELIRVMSYGYGYGYGYKKQATVAEKIERNQSAIEKLRKKNPGIEPVVISGRKLALTWWGNAWNNNLERYSDYENRIGRGSSYVRHGAVLDLKIAPGRVTALVQGSRKKPYDVDVTIEPLSKKSWDSIIKSCEGKIESLQELIDGKFPKELEELFTAKGTGLFPAPKEISFSCSCPDWASMCKHVAAVLYGIGARLDSNPGLFFVLRDANIDDLISKAITQKSETLLKKSDKKSSRAINNDDISAMFGIDMEEEALTKEKPVSKEKFTTKEKANTKEKAATKVKAIAKEKPTTKGKTVTKEKLTAKEKSSIKEKVTAKDRSTTKRKPTVKEKDTAKDKANTKDNATTKESATSKKSVAKKKTSTIDKSEAIEKTITKKK
jgi:uncharacterized Zn finger protein